jgi:hypothetical protein
MCCRSCSCRKERNVKNCEADPSALQTSLRMLNESRIDIRWIRLTYLHNYLP